MKNLIILTPVFLLTSCQAMIEEHQRQMDTLCTYEGAYSAGIQDYENGEGSNATKRFSGCSSQTRQNAMRGYNKGYAKASKPSLTTVGGVIDKVINRTKDIVFSCEIIVFTDTYSAKGRSRNEALFNAKNECNRRRHDGNFFCKKSSDYTCSQLY